MYADLNTVEWKPYTPKSNKFIGNIPEWDEQCIQYIYLVKCDTKKNTKYEGMYRK